MSVTIRQATEADESEILDLAARFIAEEHFYREVLSFDAETLGDTLRQLLRIGVVLLADLERDRRVDVVGILAGAAVSGVTSTDLYFDEVVWYVEPEARKTRAGLYLLRHAIRWAQAKGCSSAKMVAPSGSTVGDFLEHYEFRAVETAYTLDLRSDDGRLYILGDRAPARSRSRRRSRSSRRQA